jgi:hypothetical protein
MPNIDDKVDLRGVEEIRELRDRTRGMTDREKRHCHRRQQKELLSRAAGLARER